MKTNLQSKFLQGITGLATVLLLCCRLDVVVVDMSRYALHTKIAVDVQRIHV